MGPPFAASLLSWNLGLEALLSFGGMVGGKRLPLKGWLVCFLWVQFKMYDCLLISYYIKYLSIALAL